MRNSTLRLFSLGLATLALGLVQAQAKSDFSGTWKINASKTDFGPMPPPDTMTQKIVHEDPSLKVSVVQTGGSGDMNYDMVYSTDGKEQVNHMGDNEFRTTLKWEGDDLVGDTKGAFEGNEFTAKDRWSLSDGGKTMTLQRHIATGGGDFDMKLVFDKQ
ncbi:MAG TPA: hypothetical protein VMQ86_25165 [Bryobacteraceae bacterium]|nr:hypothetical protein [Bryobacteraceae bacterium]